MTIAQPAHGGAALRGAYFLDSRFTSHAAGHAAVAEIA